MSTVLSELYVHLRMMTLQMTCIVVSICPTFHPEPNKFDFGTLAAKL